MQTTHMVTRDPSEPTDGLYDTSPTHLAAVFTRRMHEQLHTGRDPYTAAGLAFHFAGQVLDAQPTIGRRAS